MPVLSRVTMGRAMPRSNQGNLLIEMPILFQNGTIRLSKVPLQCNALGRTSAVPATFSEIAMSTKTLTSRELSVASYGKFKRDGVTVEVRKFLATKDGQKLLQRLHTAATEKAPRKKK